MQNQMIKQLPKGPKSWSFLEAAEICLLQCWFRYGDKIPHTKGIFALIGSSFHDFRFRYYDHCRKLKVDSDWDAASSIARTCFHDHKMPLGEWERFEALCRKFVENRPYNGKADFEVRFGVNRDDSWDQFDTCDGFRGIVDGIEVEGEIGTLTDTKTTMHMDVPWTQLEVYAAFMSIGHPEVQEWRLVYDFARFGKIRTSSVLAANLGTIRKNVWARVKELETTTRFDPQPGLHCLECPFFSLCDYRISGVEAVTGREEAVKAVQDICQLEARLKMMRKLLKKFVEVNGRVDADKAIADFFMKETKTADTPALIKFLKTIGLNPVEYVAFPAASLRKLMKDHSISDDVANHITIEQFPKFAIRKKKKGEEDKEDGAPEEGGEE